MPDIRKICVVPMLIALATICSCQKQRSAAEEQLAQRKVELDTREEALAERESVLDQREKTLAEREKALAAREKAMVNARAIPTPVQGQIFNPAQAKTDRESRIQQLPPELRGLIPDPAQINAARAEKNRLKQRQLSQGQVGREKLQRQTQLKLQAVQSQMSDTAASPAAEPSSPPSLAVYPQAEAISPTPSPTPQ